VLPSIDGQQVKAHPWASSFDRRKDHITPRVPRRRRSAHLEADQSASDKDQTASDADQTASDADQTMADRDQAASEADQRISDRDQDLADRELEAAPADLTLLHAHERAKAGRGEGTMARMATAAVRAQVAAERHDQAWRRDEMARHRDEVAEDRDRQAEEIDESAERMAGELGADSPAAKVAAVARASAAAARAHAAEDRERAARDREDAARDRELLMAEIERSHMDESSGAYGRQIGEVLLRHEIERAQGTGAPLVLGVVTIEETAQAEDGGAASDALVRDLFFALQAKIRPYDPIVRWDDSEFACALGAVNEEEASRSLGEACCKVAEGHLGMVASIGAAVLGEDDTLDSLIERARGSARS
jgi:GGDEF domain-containing protein